MILGLYYKFVTVKQLNDTRFKFVTVKQLDDTMFIL
jgi:hypothetical protein